MIDETKLIEVLNRQKHILTFEDTNPIDEGFNLGIDRSIQLISSQPKVGEWIPVSERLPENAKHKGSLCHRCLVKTKYGVTEGWYNPDTESWYCIFWFLIGRYDETDIDFEKGDKPKILKITADEAGDVLAWQPLPEPYEVKK